MISTLLETWFFIIIWISRWQINQQSRFFSAGSLILGSNIPRILLSMAYAERDQPWQAIINLKYAGTLRENFHRKVSFQLETSNFPGLEKI